MQRDVKESSEAHEISSTAMWLAALHVVWPPVRWAVPASRAGLGGGRSSCIWAGPHPQKPDLVNLYILHCSEYTQFCVYLVSFYIQQIQLTFIQYDYWVWAGPAVLARLRTAPRSAADVAAAADRVKRRAGSRAH